jgi:molybdopterin-guanine dinucleotide biosynthesis protein A
MTPAAQPHDFCAVILAGGRARRLGGADKPGLTVGGRTLAEAVLSAVAGAAMVIVVGPDRGYLHEISPAAPPPRQPGGMPHALEGAHELPQTPAMPPLRCVREDPPGGGPVPALRRGITEVSAAWLVLLAADLPFLRPEHVHALLVAAAQAWRGSAGRRAGAIMADDGGRPQWLIGCWRTAALAGALGPYTGRSLHGLLAPLRPAELAVAVAPGTPPPWLDCDSPEDVRLARKWAARPHP